MPKLEIGVIIAIASFIVAFGGFLFTYFGYILKLQKGLGDTKSELTKDFSTQLASMNKSFEDECRKISTELVGCIHQVGDKLASFENQVVAVS